MKNKIMVSIALISAIASISVVPTWGQELDNLLNYNLIRNNYTGKQSILIENIDEKSNSTYTIGYTTADLNVRNTPSTDSEILDVLSWNSQIEYQSIANPDWVKIKYNDSYAFVYKEYVTENPCKSETYYMPETTGYKSFMPYSVNSKSIFSSNSKQYKLQQVAYTGIYGIRQVDGRYCVAVGSAITTEIGQYFDLVLENKTVIPCILADGKADQHTDQSNIITTSNGCLSEFIIDMESLNKNAKRNGDISYCTDNWNSRVEKIIVYEKNIFD